jgi:hypothetical protein
MLRIGYPRVKKIRLEFPIADVAAIFPMRTFSPEIVFAYRANKGQFTVPIPFLRYESLRAIFLLHFPKLRRFVIARQRTEQFIVPGFEHFPANRTGTSKNALAEFFPFLKRLLSCLL